MRTYTQGHQCVLCEATRPALASSPSTIPMDLSYEPTPPHTHTPWAPPKLLAPMCASHYEEACVVPMKRRMASARAYRNTNANSHPHVVGGYGSTVPVGEGGGGWRQEGSRRRRGKGGGRVG